MFKDNKYTNSGDPDSQHADDDQLEPSGEKDPIVHFLLEWCFGWVHASEWLR